MYVLFVKVVRKVYFPLFLDLFLNSQELFSWVTWALLASWLFG
jgi:hypothetical protein